MTKDNILQSLTILKLNPYGFENIDMENVELNASDYNNGVEKISALHDDVKTSNLTITQFKNQKRKLNYFIIDYTEIELKGMISDFIALFGCDMNSKTIYNHEDKLFILNSAGVLRKWIFENFEIVIGFSNLGLSMVFVNVTEI